MCIDMISLSFKKQQLLQTKIVLLITFKENQLLSPGFKSIDHLYKRLNFRGDLLTIDHDFIRFVFICLFDTCTQKLNLTVTLYVYQQALKELLSKW